MKIFISASDNDYAKARKLYDDLKRAGAEPWFDKLDLGSGRDRKAAVSHAIKEADCLLALFSENTLSPLSPVHEQLRLAGEIFEEITDRKLFVLPVKLDAGDALRDALNDLTCADLSASYRNGLVQILSVLSKFKPGEVEAPTENDALAEPPEFLVLKKFLYKYKVPTKPKTSLVSLFVLLFLLLVSTVVYYYAIWHPKQVQIDEHLALARDFLNVEAFQFAKSEFRQVMDLDKNHSEARKSLEKIGIYEAIQESDTDSAVLEQKIKALLAENPNDFHSRVLMAELYIGTDPEKAMENLQVAVEINPKAPGALFRMGILYQQQQNIPQAIEMMKKAIEVSNQSPLYRLNLGALYLKTGDEIKAEETYLALLKNDPTYLQTYFRISDLWMMRGNLNKALEFQQELAKHLENRRTCILPKNQGKWFFEIVSNQQSEIIELYDIPEKKFYAWYGMALTMYLLDRKDEATRYAEKADSLSLVGLDESIKALVLSDMSRYVQKNPSLQARSQGFEKDLLVRENMP